jgi:hypothetical protein
MAEAGWGACRAGRLRAQGSPHWRLQDQAERLAGGTSQEGAAGADRVRGGPLDRSDGVYVIAFAGLDLDETGPVCPGSSIETDTGFEHVTNAPTKGRACEGARNLASPTAGVRTCGPLVFYITEIPEDTKGALVASVERYEEKAEIVGVSGIVYADVSKAARIDPEADRYTLPQGLVEGITEVTC